jgi:hypothetical protein
LHTFARVTLRRFPIGHRALWRRIREGDRDREAPLREEQRAHADREQIALRVAACFHFDRLTRDDEATRQQAAPEVERLLHVGDLVARQLKRDSAEVHAVRVLAQPRKDRLLALRVGRVRNGFAVGVEVLVAQILRPDVRRRGRGVPGPMRGGAERESLLAGIGEGLQAGDVGGEGEVAVADGEGGEGIKLSDEGIVTADDGAAIDRRRAGGGGRCRRRGCAKRLARQRHRRRSCAGQLQDFSTAQGHRHRQVTAERGSGDDGGRPMPRRRRLRNRKRRARGPP